MRLTAIFFLALLIPAPAAALPVTEMWAMTYCSLNPVNIYACIDRGIPPLVFDVLVEHAPGERIYELSDAQLLALGLPLPSSGILFDYVQAPGGNYLYSNDRDYWDGVPLPFVALAPKVPLILADPGDVALAHAPEPATLLLLGGTLAAAGYVARRRKETP